MSEVKTDRYELYCGDCLEVMEQLIGAGVVVDLVVCDPPYNVTKNKVDQSVLDLEKMWHCLNRLVKPNGAVILFGQDKFTMKLMMSNLKNHRYNLIWDKELATGFLNANRMPLRSHEDICVFYKKQPVYNPQKSKGKPNHSKGKPKQNQNNNYGEFGFVDNREELGDMKHPKSILTFQKPHPSMAIHPTEKPTELLEFLIKSFSNENETILDFTMGSGSTIVAALNTNRRAIGIELDKDYYDIAKNRIEETMIHRKTNH